MKSVVNFARAALLLLFSFSVALATGNETINVLPDSNKASFRSDSQNFWKNEIPNVLGRYVRRGFISSGGIHGTSGSCTNSPFSFEVFTDQGNRVIGNSIAINYCTFAASTIHVAACAISGNTAPTNWVRYLTTNIFTNIVSTTEAVPSDCVDLMVVSVSGSAITNVTPGVTSRKPFPFSEGVNIEEVGGVCDGVTDNSSALQHAINLATSNGTLPGKVILTTSGCTSTTGYSFSTPVLLRSNLEIEGSNTTLTFNGVGNAFYTATGTARIKLHDFTLRSVTAQGTNGIYLDVSSSVIIERVGIEGRVAGPINDGAGQTILGNTVSALTIFGGIDIIIKDSYIKGNKGIGIAHTGTDSRNITLSGNVISGNGNSGIFATNTNTIIYIHNNSIMQNGTTTSEVQISNAQEINLTDNYIAAIQPTNAVNISGASGFMTRIDRNFIYNGAGSVGILLTATGASGHSVSYNKIQVNGAVGISILGFLDNFQIVGNSCVGVTTCVYGAERTGTTILKGGNESLVRKVVSSFASILLVNSAVQTQMFAAPIHAYTLAYNGQVRIRSNWQYVNQSGASADLVLAATIGDTTVASCLIFGITSQSFFRALYWDIDLDAVGGEGNTKSSSRCGITDGLTDGGSVIGGGAIIALQRMHTGLVNIPLQGLEANTTLAITARHGTANAAIAISFFNISVEALGQ